MNGTSVPDPVKPRRSARILAAEMDRVPLRIALVALLSLFSCLSPEIPVRGTVQPTATPEPNLSPLPTEFSFDRFEMEAGTSVGWVKAGDLDGDGDLDIVAGGDSIEIFENDGNARGWTHYRGTGDATLMGSNGNQLYDVDGDGDLDVVAAKGNSDVGWWENPMGPNGPLSDAPWEFHALGTGFDGWFTHDIERYDLDGDTNAEEFVVNFQLGYWDAPIQIHWFKPGADPAQLWETHEVQAERPGYNHSHAGLSVGGDAPAYSAGDIDNDGDLDFAYSNGWYESPGGDATGAWTWHQVAPNTPAYYGISNSVFGDMDSDGDLDIVMSAGHHGEGVYWFENSGDPTSPDWTSHAIDAGVWHPECLQVYDMDGDSDLDVVSCDLFFDAGGQGQGWWQQVHNVYVYENSGGESPSWIKHNVAADGYPLHQLQLYDINHDGNMDIIGQSEPSGIITYLEHTAPSQNWWDCDWRFRVAIDVGVGAFERYDKPVDIALNFTDILTGLGEYGALDEDSIRVIEVDAQGAVLDKDVPFQFDKDADYDAVSSASGTLVLLLGGMTAPDTIRHFHVYFDVAGRLFSPPSFPERVSLTDGVIHEEQESYEIITQNATYYYHKEGAGFASMEDSDGEDWIGYHPGGGSAGEYRGIPNMNEFAHPGAVPEAERAESMVVNQGPLKVTIFSKRLDEAAAATWEFYPEYARMTVHQMPSKYLWDYEGTPGGSLELDDYYVMSDGVERPLSEIWSGGDMAGPEWVYFGDQATSRKLFLIHHEDDDKSDQYWTMEGNMTVWGFGRTYPCCDPSMDIFPGHFTVGFTDEATLEGTSKVIDSSYQDLTITQGTAESNDCVSLKPRAFVPLMWK